MPRKPAPSTSSRIGANIRAERGRLAMTQDTLAGKAGVSCPTLRKIERGNGRAQKMDVLDKIARALGVDVTALLEGGA